jgi:hypothetical protein
MSMTHKTLSCSLAAALITAGTLLHVATASAAPMPTTDAEPLSRQEIWKRAKFPSLYPTTRATNNAYSTPVLSQQELWMRAKFPWRYTTAVPSEGLSASAPVLSQPEIWKRAKFPWLYHTDSEATRSR